MHAFSSLDSVRMNKRLTASAKKIVKHQALQGQAQYLCLSTDRGILGAREASAKKVGGIPLFKIC